MAFENCFEDRLHVVEVRKLVSTIREEKIIIAGKFKIAFVGRKLMREKEKMLIRVLTK